MGILKKPPFCRVRLLTRDEHAQSFCRCVPLTKLTGKMSQSVIWEKVVSANSKWVSLAGGSALTLCFSCKQFAAFNFVRKYKLAWAKSTTRDNISLYKRGLTCVGDQNIGAPQQRNAFQYYWKLLKVPDICVNL